MRRAICIIFMIVGIVIIGTGVFFQVNNNFINQDKEKTTKKFTFARLNEFNQSEVCNNFDHVETYIYDSNYRKISFNYPTCVHEYDLSYYLKTLNNGDDNIEINVKAEQDSIKNYMNNLKAERVALKKNASYKNYKYSDVQETINKNGKLVNFIEVNYQQNATDAETINYDEWYLAVEIDKGELMILEIKVKNAVMSYAEVESIFNSINADNEKTELLNTKKEGNYQVGEIYQNIDNSYEHGYRIKMKIPNKYPEVTSYNTNFDESNFIFEEGGNRVSVNTSIEKDSNKQLEDVVSQNYQLSKDNYENDPKMYRNINDYGIKKEKMAGTDIYYFIYSYDLYSNEKKISTDYYSYSYTKIADGFYYVIYINSKNIPIDKNLISEFMNFTVSEY